MEKKIKITEGLSNYIEGLQYELEATKDIIAFLCRDELVDKTALEYYHNKCTDLYTAYELAKKELADVYNITGRWTLDFSDATITVFDKAGA